MTTTIDDGAAAVDLKFVQGDDWKKTFRIGSRPDANSSVTYWDLTGWTGNAQIRKKAGSALLAEMMVTISAHQDTQPGYFTVALTAADSATLPASCAWDVELTNTDGFKRTYFGGTVTVERQITAEA